MFSRSGSPRRFTFIKTSLFRMACIISPAISSPTGPGKIGGLPTASSNASAAITEELSMNFVYGPTTDREVLALRFRDLGSLSITAREWQFFGIAGQPAGKLFLYSFLDLHESDSDGHVECSGGECQFSAEIQLPAGQRYLHHLQRGHAIRQHRSGKSAANTGDPLCSEIHVLLLSLSSPLFCDLTAGAPLKNQRVVAGAFESAAD